VRDWYRLLALMAGAVAVSGTALPGQAIRVGENVAVTRGPSPQFFVEPHLAVHLTDARHLLAVTIVGVPGASFEERSRAQRCAAFFSRDGGTTWARHDFPLTECYDPWVVFTPDGHAVFAALASHPALPHQPRGLVVYRSPDGGQTWVEPPVGLGTGYDHETIAVDMTSSSRRGWVYVVAGHAGRGEYGRRRFSVFVARSRTNGRTFDAPVRVVPTNLNNLPEMPVVLSDGTLVVSYVDAQWNADDFQSRAGMLERRRGWVVRSMDGGTTFSMPLFATEACGPPGFHLSALAADRSSGPFRDRLYFICPRHGGGALALSASVDGGEQWTAPVPVHHDATDMTVERKLPALAVDARGVLAVAWVDTREAPGKRCFGVYFTASLDGGRTFLPEQRVSTGRSCPDSALTGGLWAYGGDYFGLVAAPDGRFRLLWADARSGTLQLWTAQVEVTGDVRERRP
jgi:hypothetical protein